MTYFFPSSVPPPIFAVRLPAAEDVAAVVVTLAREQSFFSVSPSQVMMPVFSVTSSWVVMTLETLPMSSMAL